VLRRIVPEPAAQVTIRECYDVERTPPGDRPWIEWCMVASLDGSTVVDGRSKGLSNQHDTEVVLTLRDLADVIVVGAGTARAEGYGPPRKAGQRVGVVTSTGRVDATSPLFTSGAGFLIVPESAPATAIETIRAGDTTVDLPQALSMLSTVVGTVGFVHAEGGPRLNGALATAGLIDALNLTVSPQIAGGGGPRLVVGANDLSLAFDLAHLVVDEQWFLFSRWVRRRAC
jgi:riboflavin biosynthesis pyrimidine reductase